MMASAVDPASAQPPLLSSIHDPSREGFKRRLERIADHVGSVNALAKAANIPQSTIRKYFERGEAPSRTIIGLAQATSVRPEWLLTGCEPMWCVPPDGNQGKISTDDVVFVPVYRSRKGFAQIANSDGLTEIADYLPFKRSWLRRYTQADPDRLALLYAEGDSMEPVLRRHDMILVNLAENRVREGIYALTIARELTIKRLQPSKSGQIKIVSENKSYESVEVPADEIGDQIKIIGRVLWVVQKMP